MQHICVAHNWMKQILSDYCIEQGVMTLYGDNISTINISKNHVQSSRTKHINIHHHFIREVVEKDIITFEYVLNKNQFADILISL